MRPLIDQSHVVFYTDLSSRNEDGFTSVLPLGDGVTAIADAVNSNRLCLWCHPFSSDT
jgi:hypothetical protein